jgi:hypothetical protein
MRSSVGHANDVRCRDRGERRGHEHVTRSRPEHDHSIRRQPVIRGCYVGLRHAQRGAGIADARRDAAREQRVEEVKPNVVVRH